MIGSLKGVIISKNEPGHFTIDVHGVGYDVEVSLLTFYLLEQETTPVFIYIHTVVREDAFLLYGFASLEERTMFRDLLRVNGVGPKMAIAILSGMNPVDLIAAIQSQDYIRLTKISGVGKKTAERIVIELRDRFKDVVCSQDINHLKHPKNAAQHEAISALESLGYKQNDAAKLVKSVDDGTLTAEALIRAALKAAM